MGICRYYCVLFIVDSSSQDIGLIERWQWKKKPKIPLFPKKSRWKCVNSLVIWSVIKPQLPPYTHSYCLSSSAMPGTLLSADYKSLGSREAFSAIIKVPESQPTLQAIFSSMLSPVRTSSQELLPYVISSIKHQW